MRREAAMAAAMMLLALAREARADGQDFHEDVRVPATPDWLSVPLELGHAAAWVRHTDGPLYRFEAGILPGVNLGPLGLHLALHAEYRNPEWDLGLGGRITLRVGTLAGGFVPIRLLAEVSHLAVTHGGNAAGGFMFGLGRLAYIAALYGHDTDRPVNDVEMRFGVDLAALWDPVGAVIREVPQIDTATPLP